MSAWLVGARLPELRLPPLTLEDFQLYADASGDHAAVHLDPAAAQAFGFRTAFAHGLLSMALLGRQLTHRFDPSEIRHFSVRFSAPLYVGESLVCTAVVVEASDNATFALEARNEAGELKLTGRAIVVAEAAA
jgi:acyl dehydratase